MPTRSHSLDAKRAKYPNDLKRTGLFGTPTFNGIGDTYDKRPHGKVSPSKLRPFKPGDNAKTGHNACFSPFPEYKSDPIQDQEAKERAVRMSFSNFSVCCAAFLLLVLRTSCSAACKTNQSKLVQARKAHRDAAVKLGIFCPTSSAKTLRQVSVQQHPINTLRTTTALDIPPTYMTATHNPGWTATD
jgi:hypothetical protein